MVSNIKAAVPLLDSEQYHPNEKTGSEKALVCKSPQNHPQNKMSNDDHMKAHLRGRKTFAFWTLIVLLLVLAAGNILLTVTILSVLHLGQGMEGIELVPESSLIRLTGDVDFDSVYQRAGKLHGFRDIPVSLEGYKGGSVRISLGNRGLRSTPHQVLSVSPGGIAIDGVSSFNILHPNPSKKPIFSTTTPAYNMPKPSKNLIVKMVSTNRITAAMDQNLTIKSDSIINLHGTEGTRMDSREMIWSADQDIYLKSINGSIILSGKEGVVIDVKNIPIAKSHDDNGIPYLDTKGQFKVCVCMPQGKLFRLPITSGTSKTSCNHINITPKYNPCN